MFKSRPKIDWVNHLLTFTGTCLGVLLAVYLSNVQETRKEVARLQVAMQNIKTEIEENLNKVGEHTEELTRQLEGLDAIHEYIDTSMDLVATQAQIDSFQQQFPDFYVSTEKEQVNDSLYEWHGSMDLDFNRLEISDLAWQNAQSMDVLHLADFQKSYELHALYRFQNEVLADTQRPVSILKNAIAGQLNETTIYDAIFREYRTQLTVVQMFNNGLKSYYEAILEKWE